MTLAATILPTSSTHLEEWPDSLAYLSTSSSCTADTKPAKFAKYSSQTTFVPASPPLRASNIQALSSPSVSSKTKILPKTLSVFSPNKGLTVEIKSYL